MITCMINVEEGYGNYITSSKAGRLRPHTGGGGVFSTSMSFLEYQKLILWLLELGTYFAVFISSLHLGDPRVKSPEDLANKLSISVEEITPVKRPLSRDPGSAAALSDGDTGDTENDDIFAGGMVGVGGAGGAGLGDSTSHIS